LAGESIGRKRKEKKRKLWATLNDSITFEREQVVNIEHLPNPAYSLTILVSCSNVKSRRNLQAWFDTYSNHNSLAGTFLLVTDIMLWKSPPWHEPSFASKPPNFYSLQSLLYTKQKKKVK
jgi:hypothetical protein